MRHLGRELRRDCFFLQADVSEALVIEHKIEINKINDILWLISNLLCSTMPRGIQRTMLIKASQ